MGKTRPTTLSNKLYVPYDLIEEDDLENWHYEWREYRYEMKTDDFGEPVLDGQGEPIKVKHTDVSTLQTYKEIYGSDGEAYFALPRGDMSKLAPLLKNGYVDKRPFSPIGQPLRMRESTTGDHRWAGQAVCVNDFLEAGGGVVLGDTGSGKTVIGIGILCRLGVTTLIMSKQQDGLAQWESEIRKHTNVNDLEKDGEQIIGTYNSRKKKWYPITIATVQAFLSKTGKEWLKKHKSSFGLVMLDEVHDFGAPEFSKVVQSLNPMTFAGLTATIKRADQHHHLIFDMIGPVVAQGKAKQMPPTVYFIETGVEAPDWVYKKNFPAHYQWNVLLKEIAQSEERYKLIRKFLREDIDAGRTVACISQRKQIVKKLHLLMSQDGYDVEYVDGGTPKKVRQEIYDKVKKGKVQVLCAGKVLNQLVDLPRIDCLHFVTPASSKTVTAQSYGRARRWMKGKQSPIIRDYVDSGGQFDGAFKNRMALCRANDWNVKRLEKGAAQMAGVNIWKKRGKGK